MLIKDQVSSEEWQTRVELSACFRLLDFYEMSDLTGTHSSARVPGEPEHFLMNAHGEFFGEITASSLIKVHLDGTIIDGRTNVGGDQINPAGYTIHSAILSGREDVNCVIHTHTRAGVAVSSMKCGLLPISQHSMQFFERTSYHHYEGTAVNLDERQRLQRDLGEENEVMILTNHGLLAAGNNISAAFQLHFRLETCCRIQVDAMAGGDLHMIDDDVCRSTSKFMKDRGNYIADRSWPGHLRRLDRLDPSYRD
jgi:ribulose-5-phosphate 4-epimerase/fuculose-1-phosphate aldolase